MKQVDRLPASFLEAVSNDYDFNHDPKTFSASELLQPGWVTDLKRKHHAEIEYDPIEQYYTVFGTSIHWVFERTPLIEGEVREERFSRDFKGFSITGKPDRILINEGELWDYKTASVWKVKMADYDHWETQLNIYAWILRGNGIDLDKLYIFAILKDHSKTARMRDKDYPKDGVLTLQAELWSDQRVEAYIDSRIVGIFNPVPCTPDERFNRGEKYAVMKKGRKTAIKLFDDKKNAELLTRTEHGLYVEFRAGYDMKCHNYCALTRWCVYYQEKHGRNNG